MSENAARQVIIRQCEGMLRPDVVLPFDDPELAGCTVGDVLADPERFEGETLADPLEGVAYGRCGAKIMRRADGTPWIHSFAHGRTIYELKYDAAAVRKAMEKAAKDDVVATFVRLAAGADLDAVELGSCGSWRRSSPASACAAIDAALKAAQQQQAAQNAKASARPPAPPSRQDPRPLIRAPFHDDAVAAADGRAERGHRRRGRRQPPARDIDDDATRVRKLPVAEHARLHPDASEPEGGGRMTRSAAARAMGAFDK